MTAQEIVARIRQRLADQGISWRTETVDTFKAGNPDAQVTGIATTGMATFSVLKRAAKAGRNFVITHEPTFYNHQDQTAAFEQDATYQAKQRFIREQNLVVWRFHDHAHAIRPDPLVVGSARMLGWSSFASPTEPRIYVIPQTTLRELARDVAKRLEGRAIRVAGDPDMKVTRIALGPGYGVPALTTTFDVSVGGEAPESGGNAEYVADAAANAQPKGVIVLGHMMSEDWGMREVADWLRAFIADTPIDWVPAGEPFS
jgi:putative NIF3 family GTP cyclohydrolase 1 type 2